MQRPVFQLAEKFAQLHALNYTKHYVTGKLILRKCILFFEVFMSFVSYLFSAILFPLHLILYILFQWFALVYFVLFNITLFYYFFSFIFMQGLYNFNTIVTIQ